MHFPRLCSSESLVTRELIEYFEKYVKTRLVDLFPKNDYIIDIALELNASIGPESILQAKTLSKEDIKKIWIVEVNPFFETTDGCLFSWSKDLSAILDTKAKKPVVKLRMSPPKGASSLIYGVWKDVMKS